MLVQRDAVLPNRDTLSDPGSQTTWSLLLGDCDAMFLDRKEENEPNILFPKRL
jgi:hypothetical protein